ncbi:hypothetical protein [Candidatus Amarolinea dominans]|uniref:hypothetical protein n=1 Tax=Candidatus Amarolinea dominans TaxID=3140696 RepID=UPI003134D4D2|nr:hypothetical protein [Anaerolineae bacterium]
MAVQAAGADASTAQAGDQISALRRAAGQQRQAQVDGLAAGRRRDGGQAGLRGQVCQQALRWPAVARSSGQLRQQALAQCGRGR